MGFIELEDNLGTIIDSERVVTIRQDAGRPEVCGQIKDAIFAATNRHCHIYSDRWQSDWDNLDIAVQEIIWLDPDAETIDRLKIRAREDGAVFFEECGEALETDSTDWDSEAFSDACAFLRIPEDQRDSCWPIYQKELVKETERLAEAEE